MDYWWDTGDPPLQENFPRCLKQIKAKRPREEAPLLVVFGQFHAFRCGALYKSLNRTGLVSSIGFSAASASDLERDDVAFLQWAADATYSLMEHEREAVPAGKKIINDTHFSARKDVVQSVFEEVAGYSPRLDPLTDTGPAVVKSKRNASHDGTITTLPDPIQRGDVVYERLVDNAIGWNLVYDIRVPFILGHAPFAYLKYRPREHRFDNFNVHAEVVTTADVLSPAEMNLCRRFCEKIGLEYGELDILRDGPSGRIYIVDANNTPVGPTKALSKPDRSFAMRMMALTFCRAVFNSAL